jgi:hypothetical protein
LDVEYKYNVEFCEVKLFVNKYLIKFFINLYVVCVCRPCVVLYTDTVIELWTNGTTELGLHRERLSYWLTVKWVRCVILCEIMCMQFLYENKWYKREL